MTQDERREYLIQALLAEMPQYQDIGIPDDEEGRKKVLRSLFNVRPPAPASQEFLEIQNAYLSEETRRRGVVDSHTLEPAGSDGRLFLWQGDITRLNVDAIVNAANSALLGCFHPCHSCIDNIIHTYAGIQLRSACNEIMQAQGYEEPVGRARITPAYNLPCRYVLHTVGPMVTGTLTGQDKELLASCYRSCLEVGTENGVRSIAFCCISTGVFRFPQKQAAEIAVRTVRQWLDKNHSSIRVIFNVFTDTDLAIYQKLLLAQEKGDGKTIGNFG